MWVRPASPMMRRCVAVFNKCGIRAVAGLLAGAAVVGCTTGCALEKPGAAKNKWR